jgi:hypothetical protein
LGRPTQNHHHSEGWVWTTKAHPATRFGSVYPNRLQGLDRATQTGCKIWVEQPKLAARFGSSNPNRLQNLGRSTQTGCKIWVERPKPAARFRLSNMKVQRTFIYLNSYMVFKDPECPTYIVSITHHNSFDVYYFGVICIVYSSNTIYISL